MIPRLVTTSWALKNSSFVADFSERFDRNIFQVAHSHFANGEIKYDASCLKDEEPSSPLLVLLPLLLENTNSINSYITSFALLLAEIRSYTSQPIIAFLPYFPYSRDERSHGRMHTLAALLKTAGANAFITIDIHNPTFTTLHSLPLISIPCDVLWQNIFQLYSAQQPLNIIAPDHGAVHRAALLGKKCHQAIRSLTKKRDNAGKIISLELNAPLRAEHVIIIDDILDSGATALASAHLVKNQGAKTIIGCFTHAFFSNEIHTTFAQGPFTKLYTSDSLITSIPSFNSHAILRAGSTVAEYLLHYFAHMKGISW